MPSDEELRTLAIRRLKKKRDFWAHLAAYIIVNAFLVGVWYFTSGRDGGYFWPIWVMLGWGIGVAFNAWDAFARGGVSEEEIQREMERQRGKVDVDVSDE
jgi:hypothetical protein